MASTSSSPTAAAASTIRRSLFEDIRPSVVGIVVVLVLVAIQQGAWICEPAVFGHLIDAVIPDTDDAGVRAPRTWNALFDNMPLWGIVFVVNTIAGGLVRIASERVYGRMYARVAESLALRAKDTGASPSQTASRAELGREFVGFFEDRVPAAMTDGVSLIGALAALYTYDWRICAACFSILVPLFFIGRVYDRNVTKLTEEVNALREQNAQVFAEQTSDGVLDHFNRVADLKRRIGTWHAVNFGALRGALLVVFVVVLYVAIDVDEKSTGDVYAIVTYIWTYVTAIESLPELLENLTAARDIRNRLQSTTPLADEAEEAEPEATKDDQG